MSLTASLPPVSLTNLPTEVIQHTLFNHCNLQEQAVLKLTDKFMANIPFLLNEQAEITSGMLNHNQKDFQYQKVKALKVVPDILEFRPKNILIKILCLIWDWLFPIWPSYKLSMMSQTRQKAVCNLIHNCRNLKSLDLSDWKNEQINEILDHLQNDFSQLTELKLSNCQYLSNESFQILVKKCPQLSSISLNRCPLSPFSIQAMAQCCPRIKHINLSGCYVTDETIQVLAEKCSQLTEIVLTHCTHFNDRSIQNLALKCTNLTKIGLSSCIQLTDASIQRLVQNCPHLTSIDLNSCLNLTRASAHALAESNLNFKELNLGNFFRRLNDDHIEVLASKSPQMISVNLDQCNHLKNISIQVLAQNCKKLKSISLKFCTQLTDESIQSLAENCRHLTNVNLEGCTQLTDSSIQAIARYCPQLTKMNLHSCKRLTDVCIEAIAVHCRQIRHINLTSCKLITSQSIKEMVDDCKSLTYIKIDIRASNLSLCRTKNIHYSNVFVTNNERVNDNF